MSNIIDRRIVEMDFDNSNFERNAKTSLSTIDKLKSALNFKGSSDSLNELTKTASHFNMFGVENAAEAVKNKFSAMEVIGVGALLRIGQQAVDTGEKLVKSMSTDQIMAGWDKFAKKTTSTATLLGQGFNMEEVTEQLEKLNWFTDETSYNFTDMVDSIGKFTASGKGLTESVDAMQGIANWAALSGQNAQTASRAMYQISQAMGAGIMRKEDYKSIQNASMDTDEFRQHALDAAVALGTLKKNADGSYQSLVATGKGAEAFTKNQFTEKLTEGLWFTDKVMMQVFNDYSKGLSDVKEFIDSLAEDEDLLTSEIIGAKEALDESEGSFEEYVKNLDIHEDTVERLRDMVSNLDDFGMKAFGAAQKARTFEDAIDSVKDAASTTWMNIFELFIGDAEQATKVWTDLANYLYDVFVTPLNNLYETLDKWIEHLDNGSDDIIDIFRNIASIGESITSPIKKAFSEIFPKTTKEQFKKFINGLNNVLKSMKLDETQSKKLQITFRGLFKVIKSGIDICKKIVKALLPIVTTIKTIANVALDAGYLIGKSISGVSNVLEDNLKISAKTEASFEHIRKGIENITNYFDYFVDVVKKGHFTFAELVDLISRSTIELVGIIFKVFQEITGINTDKIYNMVANLLYDLGQAIVKFFNDFKNGGGLKGVVNFLFDILKEIGTTILEVFEEVTGIDTKNLQIKFQTLLDNIRDNLNEFVNSFNGIDTVTNKLEKLASVIEKIKNFFEPLANTVKTFFSKIISKIADYPFLVLGSIINAKVFLDIGKLIHSLSELLDFIPKTSSSLNEIKTNVNNTLNSLKETFKGYQKDLKPNILLSISAAILMLAISLVAIAAINADKIVDTIKSFSTVMLEMVGSFTALAFVSSRLSMWSALKIAITLGVLAKAVFILADALEEVAIANIHGNIVANLMSLASLFVMLIMALTALDLINFKAWSVAKILVISFIFKAMGEAVKDLADAMKVIQGLSVEQLITDFATLIGGILIMGETVKGLQGVKSKGMMSAALTMIIIGEAVKILADSIVKLSGLDPKSLVVPVFAICKCIDALANQIWKLNDKKVLFRTSIAMLMLAVSVKILADSIIKLSEVPLDELAGGFAILIGTMYIFAEASKTLNGSLLKSGAGFLAIAIGMKIISNSLIAIAQQPFDKIGSAFLVMGVALFAMTVAAKQLEDNLEGAFTLLIIAGALYIMSQALLKMAASDPLTLILNLTILAAAIAALSIAALLAEGAVPGAAALLIISAAFYVFASACAKLASLDPKRLIEDLAISIGALSVALLALMGLAALANAIGPILLVGAGLLAGAIVLIGLSLLALGAGIGSISVGMAALVTTSGTASEAVKVLAEAFNGTTLTLLKAAAVMTLFGLAMIVAGLGTAVFAVAASAISIAILGIGLAFMVLSGGIELLNLVMGTFTAQAYAFTEALFIFSKGILEVAPALIAISVSLLAFLLTLTVMSVVNVVFSATAILLSASFVILSAALVVVSAAILIFAGAIEVLALAFDAFQGKGETFEKEVTTTMTNSEKTMNSSVSAFTKIGGFLIQGFTNGMASKMVAAINKIRSFMSTCISVARFALGIRSPSRVFAEIGQYTVAGFAKGLSDTSESDKAIENVAESAIDSMNSAMSKAYDNLDSDVADPVIKPVLDLTDIQNGSNELDAIMSRDRASNISATYKSKSQYDEEQNAANASMLSGLNNQLIAAMNENGAGSLPIQVNVTLAGDAEGLFRVILNENTRLTKMNGSNPMLA